MLLKQRQEGESERWREDGGKKERREEQVLRAEGNRRG